MLQTSPPPLIFFNKRQGFFSRDYSFNNLCFNAYIHSESKKIIGFKSERYFKENSTFLHCKLTQFIKISIYYQVQTMILIKKYLVVKSVNFGGKNCWNIKR